jgi:hypothetical protein
VRRNITHLLANKSSKHLQWDNKALDKLRLMERRELGQGKSEIIVSHYRLT